MFKRIVENYQNENFVGIENAIKYAEEAKKSSKMRFRGFLNKLATLNIKGNYLEIGAGSGILATMITENNKDVNITALEISPDMVIVANQYLKEKKLKSKINFIEGNVENDKLLNKLGKFDLVYSTFSLHHWENPEKAIENLMKYVKKDGVLSIYDLKRVWWLYLVPIHNGLFNSVRAAYTHSEIEKMLSNLCIKNYEINNVFPFFIHNIIIRK